MTTVVLPSKEHCIYPGEYIPLPKGETLVRKLQKKRSVHPAKYLGEMNEFEDCFKKEISVAGMRREDIFIYIDKNILSVILLGKSCEKDKKKLRSRRLDTGFSEQHFLLPSNVDIEFIGATYKEGVLHLHVPKGQPGQLEITREVVVY